MCLIRGMIDANDAPEQVEVPHAHINAQLLISPSDPKSTETNSVPSLRGGNAGPAPDEKTPLSGFEGGVIVPVLPGFMIGGGRVCCLQLI